MQRLLDMVLSPDSKVRVGLHGTGGVGKTSTCAWICNQDAVRELFDGVAFIPFGRYLPVAWQQAAGPGWGPCCLRM